MKKITRRKVMLQGELKKGDRSILLIGSRAFRIEKDLARKIRIKNFLLGAETVLLTVLYRLAMRKFEKIPWQGADPALVGEGLMITFLFLGSVAAAFLFTSILYLPKEIHEELTELEEDF